MKFLRIPLSKLHHLNDLDSFSGLESEDIEAMKREYGEDDSASIVEAIAWAVDNPSYDFSSMLPNLSYTNPQIYQYLCKLDASLKNHF